MSNFDLFSDENNRIYEPIKIIDKDLYLELYPDFFSFEESDNYYQILFNEIPWQQEEIKYYGTVYNLPRLTAWFGDNGKEYKYSGIVVKPFPWTKVLLEIKNKVESITGENFNSVLLNLYRDGKDSISAHSDDEPELGLNPIIASVTFGAERNFLFQNKKNKNLKHKILLKHGSLVVMKGETQKEWLHSISKTSACISPRINLTFRKIKNNGINNARCSME
ncbi:alpha-ketoglutarate-dependent dioxygenase AlkB family protein [Acinetobacter sp. TR11]|uniref:alpha-ketoglutarate-dependent dioxygenase AlkB family protein n=1 Tax=Acinetobacter sp. TR11 TaxID=3003393 RepID=UPI0022AC54F2|nr:alpha-ketoglutarate-dependent dioxygenase AlkB [Acinetobacter sp. TR11]WAU74443.1 alpha-ketoglutarate-dependent dioxygenase AlkB [Acinetobacter sp. TR11]